MVTFATNPNCRWPQPTLYRDLVQLLGELDFAVVLNCVQ